MLIPAPSRPLISNASSPALVPSLAPFRALSPSVKSKASGGRHWAIERGLAVGSLVLLPAAIAIPSAPVDYAMGVIFPLHAYYGFEVRRPTHRSVRRPRVGWERVHVPRVG